MYVACMLVLYLFDVDMLIVTFVYLIFATSVVEVSAMSLHGLLVNIF